MPINFLVLLTLSYLLPTSSAADATLPDCPDSCGNLTIPYPFGIQSGCHLPGFFITCNTTFSPPRAFLNKGNVRVNSINLSGNAIVELLVARDCYAPLALSNSVTQTSVDFTGLPYTISNTRNKFTAIGCSAIALNYRYGLTNSLSYTSGCIAFCSDLSSVINGSCSGIGCCQTAIPKGLQKVYTILQSTPNMNLTWTFSPCSLAFLVDTEEYVFDVADLANFYKKNTVPVVLDWAVGDNLQTCQSAGTSFDYACGENSYCSNSTNAAGYICNCQTGYQGNPYLANGCQDINECEDAETSPCTNICENKAGSYACTCPRGYSGDGMKSGKGCNKTTTKFPLVQVIAGGGLGFLFLLLGGFSLYWFLKKRRMMRMREKFFNQNGGFLLKQELAAREGLAETARVFTAAELKRATDNYSNSRILGHGGNGTVFKGILPDTNRIVAIKKSNLVEGAQVEEFINEVVLLSQVIHKHVVRILGCCLETPVPLLVYEYVPNGTLHSHIHGRRGSLSWEARLRIADETAGALAYLHSAIARPIFHRDVKATNILLDDQYMAKVADFGASRLIPMDKAYITTLVQGTLGYLDPEYFLSGLLTEKSDVYSFGVILAEMLTGQTPLNGDRPPEEKNLAIYFLLKMKDGMLQEILEPRVRTEGSRMQVEAIADLARRCMRLKGEERPSMREVVAEIERVRRPAGIHPWEGREVDEESENFEDSETRLLSNRITRVHSETGTTTYFAASATGDESLDQHIMLSLEMQR